MAIQPNTEYELAFAEFIEGLNELSLKTGVYVSVTGGVFYTNPSNITELTYSNDPTSGDIECEVWEC